MRKLYYFIFSFLFLASLSAPSSLLFLLSRLPVSLFCHLVPVLCHRTCLPVFYPIHWNTHQLTVEFFTFYQPPPLVALFQLMNLLSTLIAWAKAPSGQLERQFTICLNFGPRCSGSDRPGLSFGRKITPKLPRSLLHSDPLGNLLEETSSIANETVGPHHPSSLVVISLVMWFICQRHKFFPWLMTLITRTTLTQGNTKFVTHQLDHSILLPLVQG